MKIKPAFIVIFLLSIFFILAVSSMLQKSATCDEIAHHIPAGYSYLKMWDFRLNPSNPPLSRYLMALPLFFLDLKAPFDDIVWEEADSPGFGRKFFFEYNFDKARLMIFLSRIPMVLVGIFGGFLTFVFASKLYGKQSGILALFLYCFSPNIIAHSQLATTDITAVCFMLFAVYSFWRFVRLQSLKSFIIAGFALGLAQLSKYTAVMLYPTFLILAVFEYFNSKWRCNTKPSQLCHPDPEHSEGEGSIQEKILRSSQNGKGAAVCFNFKTIIKVFLLFFLSIVVLWAGYGFRVKPFLKEANSPQEKIEFIQRIGQKFIPGWNNNFNKNSEYFLKQVPLPLTTYLTGLLGVIKHGHEGHNMYFMGKWSDSGNPLYYLIAFIIKTPLPVLFLFFMAVFVSIKNGIKRDELYIIIPMAMLFLTASFSKLQLGLRYMLPVYPLCFIFSSKVIKYIEISKVCHSRECGNPINFFKNQWQKFGIILLGIFLIFTNLSIWPDYLSYFNVLCGGPDNGWKVLRDSNIDWGQDLPALARYLKENDIQEVALRYFGEDNPVIYGIKYREFSEQELIKPAKTVYAISAQYIDSVKWAKNLNPSSKAGYSIFIYDLR